MTTPERLKQIRSLAERFNGSFSVDSTLLLELLDEIDRSRRVEDETIKILAKKNQFRSALERIACTDGVKYTKALELAEIAREALG